MNIAHLLEPHPMVMSIFEDRALEKEFAYQLKDGDKNFHEIINTAELTEIDDVEVQDDWMEISINDGGIEITMNYGDDDDDSDRAKGNVFFHFDQFGNFEDSEID